MLSQKVDCTHFVQVAREGWKGQEDCSSHVVSGLDLGDVYRLKFNNIVYIDRYIKLFNFVFRNFSFSPTSLSV